MARFQINPGLAGDGAIEFEVTSDDGAAAVKTRLGPQEAQDLIDLLSQVRMMTPGSVAAAPADGVVAAVVDPAWMVPPHKAPHGRVLVLRHPGLGWHHYVFPDGKAEQVSKLLVGEQPAAAPTLN